MLVILVNDLFCNLEGFIFVGNRMDVIIDKENNKNKIK